MTTHLVALDDLDVAVLDQALHTRSAVLMALSGEMPPEAASAANHAVAHVSMLLMAHQHGRCDCSSSSAEGSLANAMVQRS